MSCVINDWCEAEIIAFSEIAAKPQCINGKTIYNQKKEKTPMTDHKYYLTQRLNRLEGERVEILAVKFNIVEDEPPQNAKEFIERIQAGKFTMPKKDEDDCFEYGHGPYGIVWRDPTITPDKDGYTKALKALSLEKDNTRDAIEMLPDADALAEFRKFQAYITTL